MSMDREHRPPRPPWKEFRAALEAIGFRPSRRFGQNFLLDENTARAIVADARVAAGTRVLEVGTGCGFLTVHLAHLGVELLTVEVDPRLLEVATPFLEAYPNVQTLLGDVLQSKHALNPDVASWSQGGPWHLVANLPYAISGPLLVLAAGLPNPPMSITVLVQKEMAQRVCGEPGSPNYGPLTIGLAWQYRSEILREVGGASFWPRPKVASSVVRLVKVEDLGEGDSLDGDPAANALALARIRRLFTRRRQTLVRVMGDLGSDRDGLRQALEEAGWPAGVRAENMPPGDLRQWVLSAWWPPGVPGVGPELGSGPG